MPTLGEQLKLYKIAPIANSCANHNHSLDSVKMQEPESHKVDEHLTTEDMEVQSKMVGSTLLNPSQFPPITNEHDQPHPSDIYREDYPIKPIDASRSVDPLDLLPSELWLQAMREFILGDQDAIFTLLLVSRKWHDVVVATPWLWTTIVLKDGDDATCRIYLHQKLSNNLPLTVTIILPMSCRLDRYLEKFVAEESHRIRHLQFFNGIHWVEPPIIPNKTRMADYYAVITSTLSRSNSWPILEFLGADFSRFSGKIPVYFSKEMPYLPSLRYLDGWSVGYPGVHKFNPETLREFQVHIPFATFLQHFSTFKSLESLYFLQLPNETEAIKIPWIPRLDWSRLTTLSYLQKNAQNLLLILAVHGQTIVKLSLDVALGEVGQLISSLFTASRLQFLQVWVETSNEADPKISAKPILKELKRLEIIQVGHPPRDSQSKLKLILDAVPVMAPYLQTLGIEFVEVMDASCVMAALSKLAHIRTLILKVPTTMKEGETPVERMSLPSLQNLVVYNDDRFLERIDGPNLLALTYYGLYLSLNNPSASQRLRFLSLPGSAAGALKGGQLPALQSLVWQTHDAGCSIASVQLPALRKLKFGTTFKSFNDMDKFFEIIARYPSSCPHLEEISLPIISNWFLLLYMLYRRNCIAKVSQISTIYLTRYPGPLLLISLTQVLGGKIPLVSKELMDYPRWTIASDVSLSGCLCCLLAERPCDCWAKKDRVTTAKLSIISEKSTGWEAPLPSPTIQNWFEKLEEVYKSDYDQWVQFTARHFRFPWCLRHNLKDLVAVTSTSIHGTKILSQQLDEMIPITMEA